MSSETKNLTDWAREGVWVGVGIGTSVVAMLVGTRLLTTWLPATEYGRMALAISAVTLVVQMGATPIALTFLRYHAHWKNQGETALLLKTAAKYLAILSAIIVVFVGLLLSVPEIVASAGVRLILLTGVFALLMTFNRVAQGLEDAARSRRIRGLLQGALEIGRFSCAIGIVLLYDIKTAEAAFLGFVLAGFLIVALHVLHLRKFLASTYTNLTDNKQHEVGSSLKSYLTPLIVSNMCVWIVMMSERWVIQYFFSMSDVGGYAAVYQLAFMPMILISNFLLTLTTPIIFQLVPKGSDSNQTVLVNRYVGLAILLFSFLGSLLLHQYHDDVARMLLGPEFRAYSWIFPWLFFAGGSFTAAQQLLLKLAVDFDTLKLAKLWGFLGFLSVISYIVGAHFGQLGGVVLAVSGTNGLLAGLAILLSLRATTIKQ